MIFNLQDIQVRLNMDASLEFPYLQVFLRQDLEGSQLKLC